MEAVCDANVDDSYVDDCGRGSDGGGDQTYDKDKHLVSVKNRVAVSL